MDFAEADHRADLALSWLENGRAAEAFALLDEIVSIYPDVDRYVFRRGAAAESLGEWEVALRDFRRAIDIHPQFGIFHHTYIRLLIAKLGCQSALEIYQGLRETHPAVRPEIYTHLAQEVLMAGCDPALLLQFLDKPFGQYCAQISASEASELPNGTLKIAYQQEGFSLRVCPSILQRHVLVTRLFALVPYFDRLATHHPHQEPVLVALDDLPPEGDAPVLCFSGYKDNHLLIPDALFLESNGYLQLREAIEAHWVAWDQRRQQAYWRGALTGVAWEERQIFELPRVTLAKLAQTIPNLDARITHLQQFSLIWPDLADKLDGQGLLGPREPEIANIENQILIDVDGNSNAWSGFFLKLLCGSPTIKLMSQFRQWYYKRLTKGVHFVPIADLENDLGRSIDWLLDHPAQAEAIGKAARELALSMTPDTEFGAFHEAFAQAQKMVSHGGETQTPPQDGINLSAELIGTKDLGHALADILTEILRGIRAGAVVKAITPLTALEGDLAHQIANELDQGHVVWVSDVWGSKWPACSAAVFSLCLHHTPCEAAILMSHGSDLILCRPSDHSELVEIGFNAVQNAGMLVSHISIFGWNTLRASSAYSDFTA